MRLSNPFNAAFRFPLVSLLGLCSLPGQEQSPIPDSLELETAILYAVENNFSIRQA